MKLLTVSEIRRRMNARSYANVYRRRGLLKPQPCEAGDCAAPVQMHHEDYSKPLQVRWFCRAHHRQLHEPLRPPTRVGPRATPHEHFEGKRSSAIPVGETAMRLRMTGDAVKRRIGTHLRGYKDPIAGWWLVYVDSIERYEAEREAEAV